MAFKARSSRFSVKMVEDTILQDSSLMLVDARMFLRSKASMQGLFLSRTDRALKQCSPLFSFHPSWRLAAFLT
uniref:Cilia and flagella associated protein 100 n=1 Tax=Mus musculus TaxID=10090 RepID=A0A0N4SVH7_MOUSE